MKKYDIEGQMSLFDEVNLILKEYPGCTIGTCPLCGNRAYYLARSVEPSIYNWEYRERECRCGAKFKNIKRNKTKREPTIAEMMIVAKGYKINK